MKYTKLMSVLSKINNLYLPIVIYFDSGLIIKSMRNTGVFESCNCFEIDDDRFFEYYACAVEITEILQLPRSENYDLREIVVGKLIEISELNEPIRIESESRKIIWEKE